MVCTGNLTTHRIRCSVIRDATFSIACESGSLEAAKALAGHRLPGVTDHYLKRNVRFVTVACNAARDAFYSEVRSESCY